MQFTITDLDPADVEAFAKAHIVMQAATYAPYAKGDFTSQLFDSLPERIPSVQEADRAIVAKSAGGNIVAVAMAGDGPEEWEPTGRDDYVQPAVTRYLKTLFTMPGTHGTGLGAAMLDAVLPGRQSAYLWTMVENPRAIRFYEKHGFAADGFTLHSEGFGGMDMIRMVRV